jgi:hypothetical protein
MYPGQYDKTKSTVQQYALRHMHIRHRACGLPGVIFYWAYSSMRKAGVSSEVPAERALLGPRGRIERLVGVLFHERAQVCG